jgi:hypothetical protein
MVVDAAAGAAAGQQAWRLATQQQGSESRPVQRLLA